MLRKIFFFYILFIFFNNYLEAKSFQIIITVDNDPITNIDLENEKKILSILNKKNISDNYKNIALNNLVEESIKKKEIKKENLKIDQTLINEYYLLLIKNLNLDINKIDQNLLLLIKKKIETDKLWNNLILQKYSWKISINMNEIDKKISNDYKQENISKEKIKESLILEEKNKKLAVFSKYHLNMLKKQSLIKYIK